VTDTASRVDRPVDVETSRRGLAGIQGVSLALAIVLFIAMWVPVLVPDWRGWAQPLLLLVPAALAALVWRVSRTTAVYLSQTAIYFGLTSWILGNTVSAVAVSTVMAWSWAIAAGAFFGSVRPARRRPTALTAHPAWPHVTLVVSFQAIQAYLVLTGQSGYAAQLASGMLNPMGMLGALSAASPVITLVLVFACLATGRMTGLAIALAITEAGILTASGLRGAGIVFVFAVLIGSLVVLPQDSPWRRPKRLLATGLAALVLAGTMFTLAAAVKNQAAEEAGLVSSGSQLVTADNVVESVTARMDLSSYLERGIQYRDVEIALDAISLDDQARAAIPRFLWPEKPQVDYGHRVASVFFGATSDRTSSTITTVGDTILNLGAFMPLAAMAFGAAFCLLERMVRGGGSGFTYVVAAVLAYNLVGQEPPLISLLIDALRDLLVVASIWLVCDVIARPRRRRQVIGDVTG
jgi:hypothetical protein